MADDKVDVTPSARTLAWHKVATRRGPDLPLFDVRMNLMQHPQSGAQMERLVLSSVDWVNVVAITEAEECVMVRQYRFGTDALTLETPGGMVDPGENSGEAAARELLEETGYGGGTWAYLGAVEPNPAIHDHLCHHWLVQGVSYQQAPDLGAGEAIEVVLLSEAQVRNAVLAGEVRHSLALSALGRAYNLFPAYQAIAAAAESSDPSE